MCEKNKDFVAVHPEHACSWSFGVGTNASSISSATKEIFDVFETVTESIEHIIRPKEIEYSVADYPSNFNILDIVPPKADKPPKSIQRRQISNEEFSDYNINQEGTKFGSTEFVRDIDVIESEYYIFLSGFEGWIQDNSDRIRIFHHEEVDTVDLDVNLFSISIMHYPSTGNMNNRFETIYDINLQTATNLWFESTEFGEKNRTHLANAIQNITSKFSIVDLQVESNTQSEERLLEIVPAEIRSMYQKYPGSN